MVANITGGVSGVYLIQAGANGPVKIGSSNNIRSRFNALQSGHYEELTLLKVIPDSGAISRIEMELALNARFRSFYIRGEWYKCNILNFDINAIIAEITQEIAQQRIIKQANIGQQLIGD